MPRAVTRARGARFAGTRNALLALAACAAVAAGAGVLAAGCRAVVTMNQEDGGDASADADLAYVGPDIAVTPDLACSATGPEVCGNGCDDDRNGFTDDDDPVCTTQLLVTFATS